jgi:hypothetical protein
MTKSEMMKKAHQMARHSMLRGDCYAVNFSAALRAVWSEKKAEGVRRSRAIAQARKVRDGKFYASNIASLAMDFAGFRRWERDESRRYCNVEGLEGGRCYAMVSPSGDGAVTFVSDARTKRAQKADIELMSEIFNAAKAEMMAAI